MNVIASDFSESTVLNAEMSMYPSRLFCVTSSQDLNDSTSTYYGFVFSGKFSIQTNDHREFSLYENMYFTITGPVKIKGSGKLIIIQRYGFRALHMFGGPTEENGRLCYIDNCSTSILTSPSRLGDPILNLLSFPPNIKQTMHIHPTVRLGVVAAGNGYCITPSSDPIPLTPGVVFLISERAPHCFHSGPNGLRIIAYHPDSDFGPTDEVHPMLNRTYTKY